MVSTEECLCLFFQTCIRGNLNKGEKTEAKTGYGCCVVEDIPNHFVPPPCGCPDMGTQSVMQRLHDQEESANQL